MSDLFRRDVLCLFVLASFVVMTQGLGIPSVSSWCLCCSHSKSCWQHGLNFKKTILCRCCQNCKKIFLAILNWVCQGNGSDLAMAAAQEMNLDTLDPERSSIRFFTCLPSLVDGCKIGAWTMLLLLKVVDLVWYVVETYYTISPGMKQVHTVWILIWCKLCLHFCCTVLYL